MVPRYSPDKGSMVQHDRGTYVAASDYDRLCAKIAKWEERQRQWLSENSLVEDENIRLRAEVVHWKEARQMALDGGDLLKQEVDRLRELLRSLRGVVLEDYRHLIDSALKEGS